MTGSRKHPGRVKINFPEHGTGYVEDGVLHFLKHALPLQGAHIVFAMSEVPTLFSHAVEVDMTITPAEGQPLLFQAHHMKGESAGDTQRRVLAMQKTAEQLKVIIEELDAADEAIAAADPDMLYSLIVNDLPWTDSKGQDSWTKAEADALVSELQSIGYSDIQVQHH